MRAELYREGSPDEVVIAVAWNGGSPAIEIGADVAGADTLLRRTPVVTADASLRRLGTSGSSMLEPGSLAWFRAAVAERGAALGLSVRFVTGPVRGGWDPASQYRDFTEQATRLADR